MPPPIPRRDWEAYVEAEAVREEDRRQAAAPPEPPAPSFPDDLELTPLAQGLTEDALTPLATAPPPGAPSPPLNSQGITPTTVDLAGGAAVAGNAPASQRDRLMAYGGRAALDRGLGEDGARAVQAILVTEGGMTGAIGDRHLNPVGSHGPFQFYGHTDPSKGGQLNAFARANNMTLQQAGEYVRANPEAAIDWALDTYLGNAIRRGQQQGVTGANLATYAQRTGQVSESPERAGANYQALFGGGQPLSVAPEGARPQPRQPSGATGTPGGASPGTDGSMSSSVAAPPVPLPPLETVQLPPEMADYFQSRMGALQDRYGGLLPQGQRVDFTDPSAGVAAAQSRAQAQFDALPSVPPPPTASEGPRYQAGQVIAVGNPRARPEPPPADPFTIGPPALSDTPYGPPAPEVVMDPRDRGVNPPLMASAPVLDPRDRGISPPTVNPPAPSLADRVGEAVTYGPRTVGRVVQEAPGLLTLPNPIGNVTGAAINQAAADATSMARQGLERVVPGLKEADEARRVTAGPVSLTPGDVAEALANPTNLVPLGAASRARGAARGAAEVADNLPRPSAVPEGVTEVFSGIPAIRTAPPTEPLRPSPNPGTPGAAAVDRLGAQPATARMNPRTWPARAIHFLHEKIVNDRAPLERIQKQVEAVARAQGMPDLPPELRAAEIDRAMGGSYWTARIRVQDGLEAAYRQAGPHVEALKKYLEAMDNLDKAARIGQRSGAQAQAVRQFSGGLNEQTTRAALADLQARYSPQEWAQIEGAAQGVWRYVDGLRERLVEADVWSRQFADELKRELPHYAPTRILDYMADPTFLPSRNRLSLSDDGVRRLTTEGTDREREDITASLVRLAFEVERRAAKNEAARAVYGWRTIDPSLASLMRDVPPGTKLDKHEVAVHFFERGQAREVAIDKSLEPVVSFATPGSHVALKPFEAAANLTRITATERNPAFALAGNPLLDLPSYLYSQTSQYGVLRTPRILAELGKALVDSFEGFSRNQFSGTGARKLLGRGGGQFGYFGGSQADAKRLAREVERSGGYLLETPQDVARFLWDLTPTIGTRLENAPRIAAMNLAERYGADAQTAVMRGREATTDFSRGGEWTKAANTVVPFFNVASQTLPTMLRLAQRNPKGALASLTAGAVLPTVAAEAWNRSDPQRSEAYDDVPDYVKQQGIVMMFPDDGLDEQGRAKHRYVMLPMRSFGAVVLPTRAAMERAMGDASPDEWQEVLSQFVSGASPLQTDSPVQALGGFVPAVFGTALQLAVGKDFFRDRYIVSDASNERATAFSKFAAERTGAEPAQIEFAIRDTATGVGGILLAAADLAAKVKDGQPLQPENAAPGERPFAGAIAGRFVRHQGGQIDQDLRELREATAKEYAAKLTDALKDDQEFAGLPPARQDQIRSRMQDFAGEMATLATYGTKAKPDTVLDRIRRSPGFSALPKSEQANVLAEVRGMLSDDRKQDQKERVDYTRNAVEERAAAIRGG